MSRPRLSVFKKRRFPAGIRVISAVESAAHRLYISDKTSKVPYLIDTGADFSILPARYRDKHCAYFPRFALQTASGSNIKLFGEKTIDVNLGLRRSFRWTFLVANVTNAILGADFLGHYKLLVDVSGKKLIDTLTSVSVSCSAKESNEIGIHALFQNTEKVYQDLLRKFPEVIRPLNIFREPKHTVLHHMQTKGPLVRS